MKGFKPFPFIALALYFCVLTACGHGHPPNGPGALNIVNQSVPDGVVLSAYSVTFITSGGQGPFTWTLNSGTLPPGLTLSSDGVISGTPPITDLDSSGNAKKYSFGVKVTDSQTPTAAYQTGSFSITINPLPMVTSTTPPNGTIGVAYNYPLTNSGGLAPFRWSVSAGTLPPGLAVNGANISGTPTGTGCGPSSFTIQVTDADSNTATANLTITIVGKLQGNNAFSFNGFNNGQPFYTVGSFVGDCTGNITSGVLDQNDASGVTTKAAFTGTYSIGAGNLGSLTFTIPALNNVTYNYSMAVPLNGDLEFILADSNHPEIYGSGLIKVQTLSNLTGLPSIAGNWALGFFGVDNGGNRSAGAGSFKVDNTGTLTSGVADTNDNGTVTSGAAVTGSWALDADFATTGRGTAALSVGGTALNYAFYVVNPKSELVAVQTDLVSSGASLSLVSLLQPVLNITGGGFSDASLNGSSVMELNGYTGGSSPLPDVSLGVGQFDGAGTITLFQTDENKGGTYIPAAPVTGTYSVDSTSGRVTVHGLGGSQPVWYLVGQNKGFVIGTDSAVTQGSFEPQSGSPFSLPSFLLTYAGGTIQPVLASVTNEVDSTVIPPPGGTMNVTYDASGGPGSPPPPPVMNQMLSSTYVLGDDPNHTTMNTTGKFILTAVGSPVPTAIVYMTTAAAQGGTGTPDLSRNKWVSINVATPTGAQDPNPRMTVVQSTR
jgi:Putative Ig domain